VVLLSLSKENGVSSAKGLDRTSNTHSLAPRSPDLAACDFYLWGYVKDRYTNLQCHSPFERKFHRPWPSSMNYVVAYMGEFEYSIDICRVATGAHIEYL
jgi:hypothetical protein